MEQSLTRPNLTRRGKNDADKSISLLVGEEVFDELVAVQEADRRADDLRRYAWRVFDVIAFSYIFVVILAAVLLPFLKDVSPFTEWLQVLSRYW
jgi:hypothetical protein